MERASLRLVGGNVWDNFVTICTRSRTPETDASPTCFGIAAQRLIAAYANHQDVTRLLNEDDIKRPADVFIGRIYENGTNKQTIEKPVNQPSNQ